MSGTGTEDYIGTGWGQGQYANLYQGCHFADHDRMRYCFYRWHLPDPVWFRRDIRVTIQQIGWRGDDAVGQMKKTGKTYYKAGAGRVPLGDFDTGLFEREDDWSSCAYFYLDRPVNDLPALMAAEDRMKGLSEARP